MKRQLRLPNVTILLGFLILCCISTRATAAPVKLDDKYYRSDSGSHCGWIKNRWISGPARKKGYFTSYKSTLADLKGQAKIATGTRRSTLNKQIKKLKRKMDLANETYCNTISAPANVDSLSKIPDVNGIVEAVGTSALSGEPPTIPDLPALGVEEVFWRAGVIQALLNGTPDLTQCSEFHGGQNDGESAGHNACVQAQTIGQTFEPVMLAFQPVCYMQRGITQAIADSGAVQVAGGSLPSGGISKLFTPPAGGLARLIRLDRPGAETFFIRISSAAQNKSADAQFQATVWVCTGSALARRVWRATVGEDSSFECSTSDLEDAESGGFKTIVSAFLTRDGASGLSFDLSRERTLQAVYQEPTGLFKFKNEVVINSGRMFTKVYGVYQSGADISRMYSVSDISGSKVDELRFLQGAFIRTDQNGANPSSESSGSSEYRDTYYAAAPQNELLALVEGIDFDSDQFWDEEPSVNLDMREYSCSADPDITLTMDLTDTTLSEALAPCEAMRLQEMLFCDSANLTQAESNWDTSCH